MATILIVEDELSIANMYDFKLKQYGYTVYQAHNGATGFELAEQIRPDAILLDIKMPIMNGDEMLQLVRSKTWGQHIRVIVLTNISRDEAPQRLRLLNVDRYMVKAHHTPSQIVKILNELFV